MTLLDVQHIKNLQNPLSRNGRSLSDNHFTVESGEYVAIMGESDPGMDPFSISQPCWTSRRKGGVYLNSIDTSTIKNKDASSFVGKTRLHLQDFNLLDTLSVKDTSSLVLSRPVKEMMAEIVSWSWEFTNCLKISLRNLWWQKQRVAVASAIITSPEILLRMSQQGR